MRRLHQLGAIAIALFMLILLIGCNIDKITITSINIDPTTLHENVDIGEFNLSDIKLIVTYADESTKTISVSETMISSTDLEKLNFKGTHEIAISYQGHQITIIIILEDQATLDLLLDYYDFLISARIFEGTYQEWMNLITEEGTLDIKKAYLNQQNELVITFTNQEEQILGVMVKQTFEVRFYDRDGVLIATVIVTQGYPANPPIPPYINLYQFTGWDQEIDNIQSDLDVYPNYDLVGYYPILDNPVDELILSIDRLRNAQFDVDIESIFASSLKTNQVLRSRSILSILSEATSTSMDDPFNPNDFIQHPFYTPMYYHQGMYTMAEIVDGYHVVTHSLSTYANNAINNMTLSVKTITAAAKESAYWAVDNITVADAWINNGDNKYLLHYNDVLDRVEYYFYQYASDQKTHYYEKIFIFYNAKGEEVIERYFEYRYEEKIGGYWGSTSYYNSIAGRDFNYFQIWLNSEYKATDNFVFRGINLNDEGVYEYFENDILMISGDFGWYEMMPMINHTTQTIEYPVYRPYTVYSPDGTSNVITFNKPFNDYAVDLYIPAFNGINAVLIQEGGMIQIQQDPETLIQAILSQGLDPMPLRWEMNVHNENLMTGFRTAKGTFMTNSGYDQDGVSISRVNLYVTREGMFDYQLYHNYLGVIKLNIQADSVDLMFDKLMLFMERTGITYEYGDIEELLNETLIKFNTKKDALAQFHYLNPVIGGPENSFKDYATYQLTHEYINNYIALFESFEAMKDQFKSVNFSDMPTWEQIGASTFINLEDDVTGSAQMDELIVETNPIVATLDRSTILRVNESYTLYYALLVDGRLMTIGHELPQTYLGTSLSFTGNQQIEIPTELPLGQYQFVLFFGKVLDNRLLRISDVIPVPVDSFETIEIIESDEETEYAELIEIIHIEGSLYVHIQQIDIYAPKVMIDDDPTLYQGEIYSIELWMNIGSTVMDLLARIQISDNYDLEIQPVSDFVFQNDESVSLTDVIIGDGWKLVISDSSMNQTTLLIDFKFMYTVIFKVDDEIYHQILVKEDTQVDLPANPEKEGHTFMGWNPEGMLIISDMIYQAVFDQNTYTISYYIDEVFVQDQEVLYGDIISYLVPVVPEGYSFSGWDTTLELMPASDISVYGTWNTNSYTLKFINDLDETIETHAYPFHTDLSQIAIPTPTKTGYTFTGWDIEIPLSMPAFDLTLKAVFVINQYSITFETNGGSTLEMIIQDYDSDVIAPVNPSKDGYTFIGWFMDTELSMVYTFGKMTDQNIILYAKWQLNDE